MEHNDQVVQARVRIDGRVRIVELETGREAKENPQNFAGSSPRPPVSFPFTRMLLFIRNFTP